VRSIITAARAVAQLMGARDFFWPETAFAPRPTQAQRYIRSYRRLRRVIGILGLGIPVLLVFGEPIVFDGQPFPRGSLSAYYYSGAREVFVGALAAIGVFLVSYKVAERTRENRLSTYAGLAVITVALFPTGRPGSGVDLTPLQQRFGEEVIQGIHFVAAAIFIAALGVISYYFAQPPPESAPVTQSRWARVHVASTVLIAAALILAAVAGLTGSPDKGLLIAEWVAVWAFGASWLVKGLELDLLLNPDA
jgi:hypothetical protein